MSSEAVASNHETLNLGRMRSVVMLLSLVGLIVLAVFFISSPDSRQRLLQSYMWAWVFWGGLSFGCFAMTLLHHSLKGSWGTSVLRIWEAGGGAANLIGWLVMFIPILFAMFSGTPILYLWADPAARVSDHVIAARQPLMNPPMVGALTLVIFGIWIWLSNKLRRSTLRQDQSLDAMEEKRRFTWGPVGIVIFVLTATLAFTMWVMSLDPHWSSTMYGPWFIVGQAFAALCLAVFIVTRNARKLPYAEVMSPDLTKDLGNMMLALTMFFTYLAFSQYLIIWSGNIPEYTQYYKTRAENGWIWIGLSMVAIQFFIPFLLLINPTTKRVPKNLMFVAAWIFVVRIIDSYWVVQPAFIQHASPIPTIFDLIAFLTLGAVWFALFSSQVTKAPLLPVYDQRLKEALHHHHA